MLACGTSVGRMSPRRTLTAVIALGACFAIGASPSGGATVPPAQISIGDNFFRPVAATRTVGPGPSFHWSRVAGSVAPHNVLQDDQLFSSGAATSKAIDFSVSASAGSFHYVCVIHAGMEGTVRVKPAIDGSVPGLPFRVTWALRGNTTGSRYDVRYKAGGGGWKTWRKATPAKSAAFGRAGAPVAVKAGVRYAFRARSRNTQGGSSGWSPSVRVRP